MRRCEPASAKSRPLDFHSPYGCSKGAADQYVLDYARTFGLPAVVFRMSCIYGLHQMGTEDQGWVAHFLIRALAGKPIVLYGDGMQVRDCCSWTTWWMPSCWRKPISIRFPGQAFNIGGGLGNTVSLLELLDLIGATARLENPKVRMEDWRCGDQRYYVSDTRKFKAATGWSPKVNARAGRGAALRMAAWNPEKLARRERLPPVGGSACGSASLIRRGASTASIYFGCREPHLPLEYGYSKALLERAGHEVEIVDAQMDGLTLERRARAGADLPSRFHGGNHRAQLSVLALRAAGNARAQETVNAIRDVGGTWWRVGPHASTTPRAALKKLGAELWSWASARRFCRSSPAMERTVDSIC